MSKLSENLRLGPAVWVSVFCALGVTAILWVSSRVQTQSTVSKIVTQARPLGVRKTIPKTLKKTKPAVSKKIPKQSKLRPKKKRKLLAIVTPPKKRKKVSKAKKKKVLKQKKTKLATAIYLPVRLDFAGIGELDSHAINYPDPIEEAFELALEEHPLTPNYSDNPLLSAVEQEAEFLVDEFLPVEPEVKAVMGTIRQQDFSEHRDTIDEAKAAKKEFKVVKAPALKRVFETEITPPVSTPEKLAVAAPKIEKNKSQDKNRIESKVATFSPTLVTPSDSKNISPIQNPQDRSVHTSEGVISELDDASEALIEKNEEEEISEVEIEAPGLDVEVFSSENVGTQKSKTKTTQNTLAAVGVAIPASTKTVTQKKNVEPSNQLVKPTPKEQKAAASATYAKRTAVVPDPARNQIDPNAKWDGPLYGLFRADEGIQRWLRNVNGHVELYLAPTKSRSSQDAIHIGGVQPGDEFDVKNIGLKGSYRLYANFFKSKSSRVQARLAHHELISPLNFKKRVRFFVTTPALKKALAVRRKKGLKQEVLLTAPVFEAATGKHRNPKPIVGATVKVLGTKKWPNLVSNAQGNVRINGVPTNSELVLEVHAKGYYPTTKVVSVFDIDTHQPIYLLSLQTLGAINYYKSKNQDPNKGILMGRSFDEASRTPLAGERVKISHRRSRPLYFDSMSSHNVDELGLFGGWMAKFLGAWPRTTLRATSELGLFGFFNLKPSLRVVRRQGKAGLLSYVRKGFLNYVEFGRSGSAALSARLVDPFGAQIIDPSIRFVGGRNLDLDIIDGQFELPEMDLSGVVTLEINAEGYPSSWHNLSFDPQATPKEKKLFLLDEDVINQSVRNVEGVSRITLLPKRGKLVGGIEQGLFKGSCLHVDLVRDDEQKIEAASGPYPLGQFDHLPSKLCLTKDNPGYLFLNLPTGRYLEQIRDSKGKLLRSRVQYIGANKTTLSVH